MIKMKIKTRIISYVFISSFIIISTFSLYIYSEMKELIISTLDSKITTMISGLEERIKDSDLQIIQILHHKDYKDVYVLIDTTTASYTSELAGKVLPQTSVKNSFTSDISSKGHESMTYRFVRKTINLNDNTLYILVGISIDGINDELEEMFISVLIGAFIALLAIGVVGLLISKSILNPIKDILISAQNINSRNLSLRIETSTTKDEIYDLSITLNSLFDRLDKSFNLQKEFIANISHEIKTPLAVLNLTTDEALQKENLSEREAEYLMKINRNLNRINKLVKDIINLSYIETNQLDKLEKIDLKAMTKEILENLSDITEAKNLTVTVKSDGFHAKGEPRLIYSALMNLIYNAVKYCPENGKIDISLTELDGQAEFAICNTCDDIPDESLERLFDRFYRVEKSRSREFGGAGLGLSIVKEIIKKHDGNIIASKPEKNKICFTAII